jgi:hypothetical protein
VYVPAASPLTVVPGPDPLEVMPKGFRVRVQEPEGKPLSTTLPVETVHVGWVITPTAGAVGMAFTVSVYVAVADEQGEPSGLFVVTVMVIVLPISPAAGV